MGTPANAIEHELPQALVDRVEEFMTAKSQAEVSADDCVRFFDSIKEELTFAGYSFVIKQLVGFTGRFDFLTPIDPRARAQQALVRWLNGRWGLFEQTDKASPADHELLRRYIDVLRIGLAAPGAPILEQMLADQAVLASVEVNGLTARTLEHERNWSYEDVNHYDKRRDRASRRLLESIKLLHTIRQQAGPALQLTVNQSVAVETTVAPSSTSAPGD